MKPSLEAIAEKAGVSTATVSRALNDRSGVNPETRELRQFFFTIPREMEEAATIDGANAAEIFFYVMMPLVKPAFLAIGVMSFQDNWNNFEGPLIQVDPRK